VDRNPTAVQQGLRELSIELVDLFNNSLRPKWHRERFKNLSPGPADRPRPSIPMAGSERSLKIGAGLPAPGQGP
jgi:hypothetical protein